MEDYNSFIGKFVKIKTKTNEIIKGVIYCYYWDTKLLFIKPEGEIENHNTDDVEYFNGSPKETEYVIINAQHIISISKLGTEAAPEDIVAKLDIPMEGDKGCKFNRSSKVVEEQVEKTNKIWMEYVKEYLKSHEQP